MWIMWKCENPECNKEFITGEVDEPSCPVCKHEYAKEIGEVEVIDKVVQEGNSPLDEIAKIAHKIPFEVLKDIHQRIGDWLASGGKPTDSYIERQLEIAKESIRLMENKMMDKR